MRWLKRIVIGTLSVIVVLVALALIVPFLIPTSTYKDQIQTRVKAATGRDLILGGELKFSILPSLELSARDVTFGNRDGAPLKDMVKLKGLDLKLKLGPLLSGRFDIDALVLQEPVIVLEVDKDGKPNWQFDRPGAAPAEPAAPSKPTSPPPPAGAGETSTKTTALPTDIFDTLQVAELRIVRGSVIYSDARTGARYELAKANLEISLPGADRPFRVSGDTEYKGKRVSFKSEIKSPIELVKGQSTSFQFEFGLDLAKITLAGDVQTGNAPKFTGPLKLEVPSLRDLAAWAGTPLSPGKGFGALSLAANVTATSATADFANATVTLANLAFKFDAITATGELGVVMAAVPTVRGTLSIPTLDLNPYMSASAPPASPPPAAPAQPAQPGTTPARPGAAAPGGIDPAPLRSVNADLKIDARKIEAREFRSDQATLGIKLTGGMLTLTLEPVLLYGGSVTGTVAVNGTRTPLSVNPNLQLKGIDGHALLAALGATDRLDGTLNGAINLTGTGSDATAIQNSLGGTTSIQFTNGALRGYNLAGMFRAIGDVKNPLEIIQQVKKAVDSLNKFDPAQKTDFSELSGSFRAANGIFATNDLRMSAPLIRVEGTGTIALPASAVDMRILVKAVPTLQGQGGDFAKLGIPIPLRVQGPFSNVSWALDEKAFGDELRKKAPELIKDQILKKPGDVLKKPGGILDQFRR